MTFGGKDNRGPSIAELQRYVRDKDSIVFVLNTGKEVVGHLRWFDEHAFSIDTDGEQPFTILRTAVVGYRKHSEKASHEASSGSKRGQASVSKSKVAASEPDTEGQTDQAGEPSKDASNDDAAE